MAYLPETEEERAIMEAAEKEHRGSFGRGFIAGVSATLICMLVFTIGWQMAHILEHQSVQTEEKIEQGAQVLTDTETLYKLNEIQAILEKHFYKEIDGELLVSGLFKGVAAGTGDLYADYYSVQELQSVMDSTAGEYFGIGATLSENLETGDILVMEVYEDGPADQAGLQVGDQILSVAEQDASMGLSDLVTQIKSSKEEFQMRVYREAEQRELELTMKCGEIKVTHVRYEMKEGQIGYIRISEFTTSAIKQFENAVQELNAEGMEKLIVDLRNNPGGLLNAVCDILDFVIPKGLIVYTEDKNGNREEYKSKGNTLIHCEIAVLVNEYSASASEIFAGAVQDYELGPVMGTQTYGKGVVQKTYPLSDGSAFKMTVEKYFTPKGQDIDGNGITPDIRLEESETELEDAGKQEDGLDTDPILEKALEVLRKQ